MTSFIQTNDELLDLGSINPKLRDQAKSFIFFIYYQREHHEKSMHLQQLAFMIKEEKNWNSDKQEPGKYINLHFIDLDYEGEVETSFLEIKMQVSESNKIKLIFYTGEQTFVETLARAKMLGTDLTQISSALYSPDLHEDLAQHLGWKQPLLGDLSSKSSVEFEDNVRKWISSPGERVDMWTASITVDPQQGSIFRLDPTSNTFNAIQQKQLQEHFISHLCIGHHAKLAASYQTNRKQHSRSLLNSMIFSLESFKKFCCIGSPSLEDSTGVVSIFFQDEKGHQHEITKELVREGSKRGIMSLLFSNIDKFMGMKLGGGRLNDGKLEVGVYESSKELRSIEAAREVVVQMNAAEIFMSVGNSCLRLVHPRELRISHWGKVKLLISKDTLQC